MVSLRERAACIRGILALYSLSKPQYLNALSLTKRLDSTDGRRAGSSRVVKAAVRF
jgi:hypothetical protein